MEGGAGGLCVGGFAAGILRFSGTVGGFLGEAG